MHHYRIGDLLNEERVPLVSKFISALEQFGQPDQIFKVSTEQPENQAVSGTLIYDVLVFKWAHQYIKVHNAA